MNGDAGLIGSLVDRLTTRLPHRTGTPSQDLSQDDIVSITRATLVKLSATSLSSVLDALLTLLEDLIRPYRTLPPFEHPPHVFLSELYVLELIADCCASNWFRSKSPTDPASPPTADRDADAGLLSLSPAERAAFIPSEPLSDVQLRRIFELIKVLFEPIPEGYVPPAKAILDDSSSKPITTPLAPEEPTRTPLSTSSSEPPETRNLHQTHAAAIEAHIKLIVEFVTASSWQAAFDHFRAVIYAARNNAASGAGSLSNPLTPEDERSALIMLRLVSSFWLDGQKLSLVIQEFCSSFLHFRKSFQNAIAVVMPQIITRWLDRYPAEFVALHSVHNPKRRETAPDTLFDMSLTIGDNGRRKSLLYPMQMTLLFLQPDVFEVASNMRESKGVSMAKKVQFLDGLRKALRNRNEMAAYCLVLLLRVARHFDGESDSALMSYAMDVQDEVKDAVFRRAGPGTGSPDGQLFDQDLMTAAFVSLSHLNFESTIDSLAATCLGSSAPQRFKIALIQACAHFARLGNSQKYQPLFTAASAFIQGQLRAMWELLEEGYIEDQSAQRKAVESATTINMVCNILNFLDASPMTLFEGPPSDRSGREEFYEDNFEALVCCMIASNESVRRLAISVAKKLFAKENVLSSLRNSKALGAHGFKTKFWKITSLILLSICERARLPCTAEMLRSINDYLEARLLLLSSIPELGETPEDIPERTIASTKLETLFLVSLCSADMEACQMVTSCIATFLEECRAIDTAQAAKSSLTLLRNSEIWAEISTRDFRFTGVVAFQKRTRALLRRMQYPSAGILDAWEIVFKNWLPLSNEVSQSLETVVTERMVAEWRNYSGFLASLGGICTAEQAANLEEPAISGLRWIDRLPAGTNDEPLLTRYLRRSIQLLACPNIRVREIMREVLATEVPPSLFQPLFKALETELDMLFSSASIDPAVRARQGQGVDTDIIFVEQSSSLLRALVERLDTPATAADPNIAAAAISALPSLHLGALCLNFAKLLDRIAPDTVSSLRVKIKVCHLTEAVTKRKEHLNLRDDVRIRNQLLEYIFGWIARPRTPTRRDTDPSGGGGRAGDEMARLQRDLDRACLKSLAELTFRLPLQPAEGLTDADMSELKSQMFHKYFNRFLSLLNLDPSGLANSTAGLGGGYSGYGYSHQGLDLARDHYHHYYPAPTGGNAGGGQGLEASTADLAITILSNLLSANIDMGLKHSLSIGYHDNVEIRTAFVRVLYNILMQGAEFNNLSDAAVNEMYEGLLELLTTDMSLVKAMCAVCPSHEVDDLTIALLNIFEPRGLTFVLLEELIKQEVDDTYNESELLRRSCVATKMLSIYGKWKGASYLRATLSSVIEKLMRNSKDLSLEIDPVRVPSSEERLKNVEHLEIVTKVFIEKIVESASSMPASFRKICYIISQAVVKKFPNAKYTAVGAFIFLRFFCPAIVAPEIEGLVPTAPSNHMRRGLLLVAKIIQTLANNVPFGAKEPYMYPLMDFLTNNIYTVTTFLREISSVSPAQVESSAQTESFDFSSCVALHRFLYEHWDHIRQRLAAKERRDLVRSPAESTRGRAPMIDPLRNLIMEMSMGPPPLAVTWNRPHISANTPPAYSRFQDFMIRNAFRNTESYLTARAIYDGGESKDGLSIICIILRHIDAESIDYDTLIFCYLKIASRLWHRPFGLLIDVTGYNGQAEPKDELFQKLEMLTPTELARQLSRIYIYNMNSVSKKCLRRLLRASTRNEASVFSPTNVDYHLIGSLQDLQTHFHLSQLHLPKETISVVTDTRYVFQPVTRLSRTRGKIEVVIKVGSQYVQVTTCKKQEVPGFHLSTTINDIFRLGEIEEAPTMIQTEDDSAFCLRADNGKIVMYFTSPKKADVLQAIRLAKAKYSKDMRSLKTTDRLIRPQDVPGTLLNLALTNLASDDPVLRLSAYNLLSALCKAFKFTAASKLMSTKDISVPLDPSRFIIKISKNLAETEPQLTSDFLTAFFVGWESFSDSQKPLSLAYMAPWIPGLRTSLLASEPESEKGREKIAVLFRKLIEVAFGDAALMLTLEQSVWPAICQDEVLLDIFLDEIIKTALTYGFDDEHTEVLTSIASSIGTITLRGKIISRLRKAVNRSSLRPTKHLPDNTVWNEICVLLQFCLALSFDSGIQAQMYLPEIFHIVTMLANTGAPDVRIAVHRLLINSLHSACTSFSLDETRLAKLRATLDTLSDPKNDIFVNSVPFVRDGASISTQQESGPATLAATEHLATILFEVCSLAAPSVDLTNAWRARWMGLVASTAFQNNPAIQPRAFTVMGCLAREDVDDDLLYQVLVALRHSVNRYAEDGSSDLLVSILTALSKMMIKLPTTSRYGLQLFWLAVALLRLVPANLFNCTALFLEAVLANIRTAPDMRGDKLVPYLLQGRAQLEDVALPLDDAYGIHFNADNFHFAACACLVRGLTDAVTRPTALRVLSTFLEITTATSSSSRGSRGLSRDATAPPANNPERDLADFTSSPYMSLMLARAASVDELREHLWEAGLNVVIPPSTDLSDLRATIVDLSRLKDKDLLLNTALELIDFRYLDDASQSRTLTWLNRIATARPTVAMPLYAPVVDMLDEVLMHCQNSSTLKMAHVLLQTLTVGSGRLKAGSAAAAVESSAAMLGELLDELGVEGLWKAGSRDLGNSSNGGPGGPGTGVEMMDREGRGCFGLTEKLIELIIM